MVSISFQYRPHERRCDPLNWAPSLGPLLASLRGLGVSTSHYHWARDESSTSTRHAIFQPISEGVYTRTKRRTKYLLKAKHFWCFWHLVTDFEFAWFLSFLIDSVYPNKILSFNFFRFTFWLGLFVFDLLPEVHCFIEVQWGALLSEVYYSIFDLDLLRELSEYCLRDNTIRLPGPTHESHLNLCCPLLFGC